MDKTAPPPGRLVAMVVFSLSCFGLLLFLWISFGGATPLKPDGYRVVVPMQEAFGVTVTTDVRISGVSVGRVTGVRRSGERTRVEVEVDDRYAPLPADVRATLRRKTLVGEAYLELSPGDREEGVLPDGGTLPTANVRPSVDLDEVLSGFDTGTRRAIRGWLQGWAHAVGGRARDVSDTIGHLPGALEGAESTLSILRRQRRSTQALVRDAGRTFAVLGRSDSRLRELVTAGERLFSATAAREEELSATVASLPPFLRALRRTLDAAEELSGPLAPVIRDLRPGARVLRPTLTRGAAAMPELEALATDLDRLIDIAPRGLRDVRAVLDGSRPLFGELYPLGRQLAPIADFVELYRGDLANSWPKVNAATQATTTDPQSGRQVHYLRATAVFLNETVSGARRRQPYSRPSTYALPGGVRELESGVLKAFDCSHTGNPVEVPPLGPAPPCLEQGPITFQGRTSSFPRLEPAP